MTFSNNTEKRYVLTITLLFGTITFLLGTGSTSFINNLRLNSHVELEGHPITVQRLNELEKSDDNLTERLKEVDYNVNDRLKEVDKKLTTITNILLNTKK